MRCHECFLTVRAHTGGLFELLDAAPNDNVVTTFLGVGIMSTASRRADNELLTAMTSTPIAAGHHRVL